MLNKITKPRSPIAKDGDGRGQSLVGQASRPEMNELFVVTSRSTLVIEIGLAASQRVPFNLIKKAC